MDVTAASQKNFPPKKAAAFALREGRVAAALGVSRDVLRELRQNYLEEGKDFARLAKKIHYTEEALDRLRVELDLDTEEQQALLEAAKTNPDLETQPEDENDAQRDTAEERRVYTLVVWKTFSFPQPDGSVRWNGVLEAHPPGTDPLIPENLVRVSVRSGENFVRGMEIPAWHVAGDVYDCARPDPRSRGVW